MMARQMKFLPAAIGVATVIAALAVARMVHTRAAPTTKDMEPILSSDRMAN